MSDAVRERQLTAAVDVVDERVPNVGPVPGKLTLTSMLPPIYRDAERPGVAVAGDAAVKVDVAARSPGTSLPGELRGRLETALGVDLAPVQLHTDGAAAEAAAALHANAFTRGQDVFFGAGRYAPGTEAGDELIAHEVAHTVQQRGASESVAQADLQVSEPGDRFEVEAEEFASAFARGERATVTPVAEGIVARELIQRQEGPQPQPAGGGDPSFRPGDGTFRPEITKDEDKSIKLFEHWIHTFRITNHAAAPQGTTYHWGGGLGEIEHLDLIGTDTQDNNTKFNVWVQGMQTGVGRVSGILVHQVPGGPETEWPPQTANITVGAPTLSLRSLHSGPESILDGRLAVGDEFKAMIEVGNVDGQQMPDPAGTMLGGTADLLEEVSRTVVETGPDSKTYDVLFRAARVGSVNMTYEFLLGRNVLGAGPSVTIDGLEIEMDRQAFINACAQCHTRIDRAYTRLNSIMEVSSSAYGIAWQHHLDTLAAQGASNRLVGDLILAAALAFVGGAAGGAVGGLMRKMSSESVGGAALVDGLKDLTKWGTRGLMGAGAPSPGNLRPISTDPLTWRAQYAVRVNGEKEQVLDTLDGWQTKANTRDPTFFLNFDPITVMDESLKTDGQPSAGLAVPDQAALERDFELGFWREWLTRYAFTVHTELIGCPVRPHHRIEENQGKKIRDRINALGQNGDQWLEQYGGISRRAAEEERDRRRARGMFG